MPGVIERILPPAVVVVESFTDPTDLTLHPDEEPLVANAVEKRRREFTTVRDCARRAMARLGIPRPRSSPVRGACPSGRPASSAA
ncbi:hypothetical protein JD81_03207 [Micromonospora sagamiensis]|uniref:4'-phosphopantetheinyl transferase N-terminal domain-containing protein n=1 Tax=Micromonospora sagamiensis TaxID=47875 RepID=A0A562WHF9_9ACTN|nr:hypothetical protein JD81_03207 [Micromonospora sagamiensis]